jgi:4-alpha-glucanotransferase
VNGFQIGGDVNMNIGSPQTLPFPPEYRASGLLLHVTSLPSKYGIGDVGPAAMAWIDQLRRAGQRWWQALPLGPTGYGNSPYQPLSSFAGNELIVSPEWLIEDGLLRKDECEAGSFRRDTVDYDAVTPFKRRLLKTAWANFAAGARRDLRASYEQFRNDQAHWLEDYALFRALKAKFSGAYFLEWPRELAAWHVPQGAPNSRQGQWVPGPGSDFFRAADKELGALPFIAEDLGVIAPDIVQLRDSQNLPGMRVLRFGFDGNRQNPHLPHTYVRNTVVYTGTHDNNTTRGWYEALPEPQRETFWTYLRRAPGENREAAPELMRLASSSPAALAIAPFQDVLNLGAAARMNMPGQAGGNWRWRLTDELLSPAAFDWLADLTKETNRASSTGGSAPSPAVHSAGAGLPALQKTEVTR